MCRAAFAVLTLAFAVPDTGTLMDAAVHGERASPDEPEAGAELSAAMGRERLLELPEHRAGARQLNAAVF